MHPRQLFLKNAVSMQEDKWNTLYFRRNIQMEHTSFSPLVARGFLMFCNPFLIQFTITVQKKKHATYIHCNSSWVLFFFPKGISFFFFFWKIPRKDHYHMSLLILSYKKIFVAVEQERPKTGIICKYTILHQRNMKKKKKFGQCHLQDEAEDPRD